MATTSPSTGNSPNLDSSSSSSSPARIALPPDNGSAVHLSRVTEQPHLSASPVDTLHPSRVPSPSSQGHDRRSSSYASSSIPQRLPSDASTSTRIHVARGTSPPLPPVPASSEGHATTRPQNAQASGSGYGNMAGVGSGESASRRNSGRYSNPGGGDSRGSADGNGKGNADYNPMMSIPGAYNPPPPQNPYAPPAPPPRTYTGRPNPSTRVVSFPPPNDGSNGPMSPRRQPSVVQTPADWIVPTVSMDVSEKFRRSTVKERLDPTLAVARTERAKFAASAKQTGMVLNCAIGAQVLLGALVTSVSAATTGRQTSIATAVLGGMTTLVASYLAKMRGSSEPDLSITRTKDLDAFIREVDGFVLDHGSETGFSSSISSPYSSHRTSTARTLDFGGVGMSLFVFLFVLCPAHHLLILVFAL
ncbi:hypothetical protein JAAARDRAFT_252868 [Jaapia argillacea MUCL 33604]|uniref:SMODS and SLOG-associating 2TM effector domain-containing protein n=1 Tax=Jaapia argillacea MUCL 33604 TaxID=933084 RepID=A0A067Q3A5_9AGAM|nr:hypothetical protein JAAARDRAFT_252868 [Jaapia argillacea MUCL 33604]